MLNIPNIIGVLMTLSEYCGAVGNVGMGTTLRPRATACIALRPQVGHRPSPPVSQDRSEGRDNLPLFAFVADKSDFEVVIQKTFGQKSAHSTEFKKSSVKL